MTVGERIKQKRIELNLSQDDLAKKVGYKSRSSIQKIEAARKLPLDKVETMALALDCTPGYLMGWEDESGEQTPHGQLIDAYVNNERQEKANALYDQYESLPPEKQAQFDNFLKFLRSDVEIPHLKKDIDQ